MTAEQKPAQDVKNDSSLSMGNQSRFAVVGNVLPELTLFVPLELLRIVELSQELTQHVTGISTGLPKIGIGEPQSLSAMATLAGAVAQRECAFRRITSRRTKPSQN